MPGPLRIAVGQHSDRGAKETNQDFHGVCLPKEPQLSTKGVVVALADGISSSDVGHLASRAAVRSFLADYYCTSEAWSVKRSGQRVLAALNSWLHSQTRHSQYRYDRDRGYVCTFSALVIKSNTAHVFHVGDSRIYRLVHNALEQLTNDHRLRISPEQSYLSRALGINEQLEIDYRALPLEIGDIFLLATDGVYEHAGADAIRDAIAAHGADLDAAARAIVDHAYRHGSPDNLTVQIVRIENLPDPSLSDARQRLTELPFPPLPEARAHLDGYTIARTLHSSSRSHVFLAIDDETQTPVIIKTPSIDRRGDLAYLERFLTEDWIARRIDSPHVLKPCPLTRQRNFLYVATEYIQGQTLRQWMIDHPRPDLESVRTIVEQIAKGLRAFHRLEMLHQDLRPDNVMIDASGTVKIIDFGSTHVAGLAELAYPPVQENPLGTAPYTAPEYFLGQGGTDRSDQFSLGVIAYQMLTGNLPYGTAAAKVRTRSALIRLHYRSARSERVDIPVWVDETLRRAVHPNPRERYEDLSEFVYDLRHPNRRYLQKTRPPLLERDPVLFWKGVSLILLGIVVVLLARGVSDRVIGTGAASIFIGCADDKRRIVRVTPRT